MNEQEKPPELLPCPWCRVPPEVCKAAGYGFTVECVNETCAVAPALNVTRGRQNAITAWNTRADLVPADVWDEAINVLRGNLCTPYVAGSCEDCDTRMRDIERLEAARDKALKQKGTKG